MQVMAVPPVGHEVVPLPLLMCPYASNVFPLPTPSNVNAFPGMLTKVASAVSNWKFPPGRNITSPPDALLYAFCMHRYRHMLPEVPFPVHPDTVLAFCTLCTATVNSFVVELDPAVACTQIL